MDGMFPAPKACAFPGNSTRMTQKTRSIEVVGPHLRLEEAMMRFAEAEQVARAFGSRVLKGGVMIFRNRY